LALAKLNFYNIAHYRAADLYLYARLALTSHVQ